VIAVGIRNSAVTDSDDHPSHGQQGGEHAGWPRGEGG